MSSAWPPEGDGNEGLFHHRVLAEDHAADGDSARLADQHAQCIELLDHTVGVSRFGGITAGWPVLWRKQPLPADIACALSFDDGARRPRRTCAGEGMLAGSCQEMEQLDDEVDLAATHQARTGPKPGPRYPVRQ